MGVAVREKQNGSGIYWLFIRHAGERVSQLVGDRETAEEAKKEILREIRLGRFDIAAMKAARAQEKVEETTESLTLRDYYEKAVEPLWEGSLSRNTHLSYDGSFRVHILPALGDVAVSDLSRDRVKKFVTEL